MRDFSLYLIEFNKFVQLIVGSGRVPAESDVDLFIDKMWTKPYWSYDENNFADASTFKGVQAFDMQTGERILDIESYAFPDYVAEVKPMLMDKLEGAVGEVGDSAVRKWNPTPIPLARLAEQKALKDGFKGWRDLEPLKKRNSEYWIKADAEISYIKTRILEYNRKIVPYQLKKTMHHMLTSIHYSTSNGKCFVAHEGSPIIHSEEEIEEFMQKHVETGSHRALWFSISNTGENYKAGVADIDFHDIDVTEREKKKVVKEVAKRLQAAGYPILIQYSGHGYHVWFGQGSGPPFNDRYSMNNLIRRALGKVPGALFKDKTSKAQSIAENLAIIELEERSASKWGMFFGLQYKPHSKSSKLEEDGMWPSPGSGVVRVPLTLDQIDTFDPLHDAHPEHVLANFDRMAILVDNFFDEVEIGYGHEEEGQTESQPPCLRSDGVEAEHPLAIAATQWKKKPEFTQLRWQEALEMFADKSDYHVSPKFNGTLFAIHFKEEGGHRVGGTILTKEKTIVSRASGATTLKSPVTTIMASKGGVILWENHITREFEDTCVKRGISEALFVGELFQHDEFGVVKGPQAVTAVIMRNQIDPKSFRQLRYALFDAISIDNNPLDVGYSIRHGELVPFEGDKVKITPIEHIPNASGPRLEALWNLHVKENQQEGLVIHHEGKRFKIKRKYTLDAVIMSVSTNSKPWQDNKKTRHVFEVALAKKTKYGDPTYVFIGSVGWGPGWDNQKQAELFDMVMGEQIDDDKWEHSIKLPNVPPDDPLKTVIENRHFVEPRIVVEIEFESLSEAEKITFASYEFQASKKAGAGRRKQRSGYRLYPQILSSKRMLGPAIIKQLRPDKDPKSTFDIRLAQAEGAGGFQVGRPSVRTNPVDVYGYPPWIQSIANFFPIVPSTGSELERVLILDSTMSKNKFRLSPQGFPREQPWLMPIEAYRKLWNLSKRSGRQKEFGGYVKDGTIYYGSSQHRDSINMWITDDSYGADFIFHTHPRNHYNMSVPSFPIISAGDLSTSLTSKFLYGIPWELIVAPHGFVFYRPKALRKGSKVLKSVEALEKTPNLDEQVEKTYSELTKESDRVVKSYEKARKKVIKQEEKLVREKGFVTEHPSWTEDATIDAMNMDTESDVLFEYVYVPLYVFGPNFRKKKYEAIKSNPSTGYYGVSKKRPTFEAGVIGPDGAPMPSSISFDKEFSDALARGRRGDPNEKGYKLYKGYNSNSGEGYAFVLGLPINMQLDFSDMYGGPGATGVAMLSSDEGNIRATTEQFNYAYQSYNPEQSKNDLKVIYSASMEMPPKEDPEIRSPAPTLYDTGRNKGSIVKEMESALKGATFTSNQTEKLRHLNNLKRDLGALTNPPTDIGEWDERIELYTTQFKEYELSPTYQSWMDYASSAFPLWEIPLLEKGRLLNEAIENYTLTEEEEARVRQEYSSMSLDLANPLGNLLTGLDSEEEDFEEGEEYDETE